MIIIHTHMYHHLSSSKQCIVMVGVRVWKSLFLQLQLLCWNNQNYILTTATPINQWRILKMFYLTVECDCDGLEDSWTRIWCPDIIEDCPRVGDQHLIPCSLSHCWYWSLYHTNNISENSKFQHLIILERGEGAGKKVTLNIAKVV